MQEVIMPDPNKDVKLDPSSSSVKGGSQPLEELLAKAQADNERMKGALASLQSERDEMRGRLGELEEIEDKRELSRKEEAERLKLQRGQSSIEDQIEELKHKPEAKPWMTHLEREVVKASKLGAEQGRMDALTELAADFLEEAAEELSSKKDDNGKELYAGLTEQKLLKELKPYLGQFENKNPYMKVKKAYKAWLAHNEYLREKDEIVKAKAELNSSKENGTRTPRATNLDDAVKAGDRATQRELLGIMHRNK